MSKMIYASPAYAEELIERLDHLQAQLTTVREERDYFHRETLNGRAATKRLTKTLAEISGAADARLDVDGRA